MDAQIASRRGDCHRALWLELELSKVGGAWKCLMAAVQGMSRVVGDGKAGCSVWLWQRYCRLWLRAMGSGGGVACEYGQGYCMLRFSMKVGEKSSAAV